MTEPDLSLLPRVDRVARHASLDAARAALGERVLVELARAEIAGARAEVLAGGAVPTVDQAAAGVLARAQGLLAGRAARVVNATGVLVHTNLGRAPLSPRALARLAATSAGASSVELDLATGRRGRRAAFLHAGLAAVSGAEAALVVNNCAAAVLLVLSALAAGRPVIVSRGELVEIGGGFRVPEVLARSGARLVEVGTTNKTRVGDYARALDAHPDAAALLRVHQGNFRQVGFVERPELAGLAALARERGVLLLEDLGGGALVELAPTGFVGEPTVQASIAAGVDLTCFSTDKVLGGPQGGAIVGRRALVERVARDPLARAVRLGRLPLVALEATVEAYLEGRAFEEVPTLARAAAPLAVVEARARRLASRLAERGVEVELVPTRAEMGGGTLADRSIASAGVALPVSAHGPDELARRLRAGDPPVVGHITADRLVLDLRTVDDAEVEGLAAAVAAVLG